ncbi:restriction endonuclease subunit S [Treponema sp.]|uniref:restriction endonuclease subunit S n=1 Tax=Treponema sp. TaxID=166 RepID=UPI003F0DE5A9
MQAVKWGEFRLGDLFEKIKVNSLKYKTNDLPSIANKECDLPALTAGIQNQGLNNYVPRENATILKNVISISANGANTGATFFQSKEFTVLQDAYAIDWIYSSDSLTENQYLFLVGAITKTIYGNYEWTNKAGWERIKNDYITLPVTSTGEIDFDFMESFIRELEEERIRELEEERIRELAAYLTVSGLADATLTANEEASLLQFKDLEWQEFNVESLFGKSTRGKRLKSDDRIEGYLPFVTAGEADEGISAFISNKVEVFSKNTTTIDMFGSAKYRNYNYGADDHVAVVHTENLPKYAAVFVTTACHKSAHNGQFNYGHNFYAKDADELYIYLPVKDGKPDYEAMETFISAVQKLVIKDVVKYADERIAATKDTVYKIPEAYGKMKVAESEPSCGK